MKRPGQNYSLPSLFTVLLLMAVLPRIEPLSVVAANGNDAVSPVIAISPAHRISASPDVAVGPDGSINLIWVDKGEAQSAPDNHAGHAAHQAAQSRSHSHKAYNNLYFARSTDGKTFSKPLRLNVTDGELWGFATSRPRIAVSQSGIIHVFYHANRRDRSAMRQAVDARYVRSTDGGKTFSAPRTLNSEGKGMDDGELDEAHCFGTMGVAPNGDVHAFWIDTRHMTSEKDNGAIYSAVSRSEGKTFERERMLFRNSACPCCQLNVAFSAKGEIILSARHVAADGARDSSIAISKDGGRTYSDFVTTASGKWIIAACPLKPTQLATDRDGRIFAAWFSGGEKPAGSYFSVSEDGGKTFSRPMALHAEASTPDRPQLAVGSDGSVRLAWDAIVGKERRVYLRTSTDHGKSFGAVVELDAPSGAAGYPAIAAGKNGMAYIAWQQNNRVMLKALSP
jgi:hypothetical protein